MDPLELVGAFPFRRLRGAQTRACLDIATPKNQTSLYCPVPKTWFQFSSDPPADSWCAIGKAIPFSTKKNGTDSSYAGIGPGLKACLRASNVGPGLPMAM